MARSGVPLLSPSLPVWHSARMTTVTTQYGTVGGARTSDGVTLGTTASCWGVGTVGDPCEGKALGAACTPTDDDIPF